MPITAGPGCARLWPARADRVARSTRARRPAKLRVHDAWPDRRAVVGGTRHDEREVRAGRSEHPSARDVQDDRSGVHTRMQERAWDNERRVGAPWRQIGVLRLVSGWIYVILSGFAVPSRRMFAPTR